MNNLKTYCVTDIVSNKLEKLNLTLASVGKKKFPENRSLDALNNELKPLSPAKDYVLFYIRPSGVDLYAKLKDLATDKGLQVGSDAVGEKTEMEFTRDLEE